MIEVQGLTKWFAQGVIALDDVSFSARPGEVLGFLGPNGAGKTTTLRILTGYLRPSKGRAAICGCDVVLDSLLARQHTGYLPEQVPLYGEMRVSEYLRHRAELKGVPRAQRTGAIGEAVEQVGLRDQVDRIIGQLSKGYRQRVGLADALLHRPDVLILDEPTDGLDPNQRREVLDLVRELGKARTVVLSTHVLPEVETVCQRVVIIDRGKVVAAGTTAELLGKMVNQGRIEIVCRGDRARLAEALAGVPGVVSVEGQPAEDEGGEVLRFLVQLSPPLLLNDGAGARSEGLARAVLSCGELRQLMPARSSLEAVFRWLTAGGAAEPASPESEAAA